MLHGEDCASVWVKCSFSWWLPHLLPSTEQAQTSIFSAWKNLKIWFWMVRKRGSPHRPLCRNTCFALKVWIKKIQDLWRDQTVAFLASETGISIHSTKAHPWPPATFSYPRGLPCWACEPVLTELRNPSRESSYAIL